MIDLGHGIKISKDMKAKLDLGLELAEFSGSWFRKRLEAMTVPELKALCAKAGIPKAGLRGLTVKKDFVDKMMGWHTAECLKSAGYKADPNTFGPRLSGRS